MHSRGTCSALAQAQRSQAVTPTATGALLFRYAERILAKAGDIVNAAQDLRELKTGKLHIAASQTPGVYHVPRLIGGAPAAPVPDH